MMIKVYEDLRTASSLSTVTFWTSEFKRGTTSFLVKKVKVVQVRLSPQKTFKKFTVL